MSMAKSALGLYVPSSGGICAHVSTGSFIMMLLALSCLFFVQASLEEKSFQDHRGFQSVSTSSKGTNKAPNAVARLSLKSRFGVRDHM